MERDLCSVIIPAYNCASFIEETLDSVLAQTYKRLEVIIINDCSPDHTDEIIAPYLSRDKRIRYLHNESNLGVAETRNRGVREARGEWIALLDSDDCWLPDKVEKQMRMVREKSASICYTGCRFISHSGDDLKRIFNVPEQVSYKKLLQQNVIVCSSILIKRDLLLKHPMHGDFIHEDYIAWLTILKEVPAFGLNEPLVKYRLARNSKSRNKFKSIKMTYQVYKHMNLSFPQAHYYLARNVINGLKKYGKHAF